MSIWKAIRLKEKLLSKYKGQDTAMVTAHEKFLETETHPLKLQFPVRALYDQVDT